MSRSRTGMSEYLITICYDLHRPGSLKPCPTEEFPAQRTPLAVDPYREPCPAPGSAIHGCPWLPSHLSTLTNEIGLQLYMRPVDASALAGPDGICFRKLVGMLFLFWPMIKPFCEREQSIPLEPENFGQTPKHDGT
jgi:hypothetical protein